MSTKQEGWKERHSVLYAWLSRNAKYYEFNIMVARGVVLKSECEPLPPGYRAVDSGELINKRMYNIYYERK